VIAAAVQDAGALDSGDRLGLQRAARLALLAGLSSAARQVVELESREPMAQRAEKKR
jgi:hypothetical protein